jgi:hypothetical protein
MDITKVIFVREKLPDGFTFPPAAIAPSLNMSRPSAKTRNPLGYDLLSGSSRIHFPISSFEFRMQELFNLKGIARPSEGLIS